MKFYHNNEEIPWTSCVIYEDITQYYSTMEFTSPGLYSDQFTVESSKREQYKILRCVYENKTYRYTIVPENVYKQLNLKTAAFTGKATVQTLLNKIGVPSSISLQTTESDWIVEESNLVSVLKTLESFSRVNSGGAPVFFVQGDGKVTLYDLKFIYEHGLARRITASVSSDKASSDWLIRYPGSISVVAYSNNPVTKLIKLRDQGSGTIHVNDTTGFAKDAFTVKLQNDFWKHYYTSRVLNCQIGEDVVNLGDLISINEVSDKFIVAGRTIVDYNDNKSIPSIMLRLVAPCPGL